LWDGLARTLRPVTDRTARRLAWGLWLITITLSLVAIAFIAVSFGAPLPDNWGFRGYGTLAGTAFVTAGALIASRIPRNAVAGCCAGSA
jgi:hypothetical protein